MDADRFDALARSFLIDASRRTVLGLSLGGTLGLAGWTQTEARKHKRHKKHKKHRPPTCVDGAKNGSESDVDCGGSCPRCADGKRCGSRDDCASAVCTDGICVPCQSNNNCVIAGCSCGPTVFGGDVCFTVKAPVRVASCNLCPAGTDCVLFLNALHCIELCRAA